MKKNPTSSANIMLIHFDDIFEQFSTHTIRTKRKVQINGAIISPNIFIPDSFFINGYSLRFLKGKILKASLNEMKIVSIEGVDEN